MTERIEIGGMSCGGCVNSVRKALDRLPLEKKEVEIGSATVEYDEGAIGHDAIVAAILDAGFEVLSPAKQDP